MPRLAKEGGRPPEIRAQAHEASLRQAVYASAWQQSQAYA